MKKRYGLAVILMLILTAAIITGCSPSNEKTENTGPKKQNESVSKAYQPVTVENADRRLTFQKPPKRAVALLQQDAELMLTLGLKDELVGYSLVSEETPPKLKKQLKDIPILAKGSPSKEVLLNTNPDFVIGTQVDFGKDGAGTLDGLKNMGITPYVTKLENPETVDNQVYKEINDLARIFGVKHRGEELVQSMKDKVKTIKHQVGTVKKPLKVFYMSGGKGGAAQTTGGDSLETNLIESAGGENIFSDLKGSRIEVSWEKVIERNPDVIVMSYCCGTGPGDLKDVISKHPSLESIKAVQNKRYVTVAMEDVTGTVRIPKGLETLAKGFYPERFK